MKTYIRSQFLILLVLSMFVSTSAYGQAYELQIERVRDKRILWTHKIEKTDEFLLKYTHSVDGTPVEERYRCGEDNAIIVDNTRFKMIGAGIEFHPHAGIFKLDDGWITVSQINRRIERYLLRVGKIARPKIVIHDETVDLLNITSNGDLLEIKITGRDMD